MEADILQKASTFSPSARKLVKEKIKKLNMLSPLARKLREENIERSKRNKDTNDAMNIYNSIKEYLNCTEELEKKKRAKTILNAYNQLSPEAKKHRLLINDREKAVIREIQTL